MSKNNEGLENYEVVLVDEVKELKNKKIVMQ